MRWTAALAAGALVLALVDCGGGSKKASTPTITGDRRDGDCVLDDQFDPGRGHVPNGTAMEYKVQPPSGGDHWQSPLPPGVYQPEDNIPEGPAVHSLEHGYVLVWYREGFDSKSVTRLSDFVTSTQPDTLLLPAKNLPVPVAATAWHHRLLCNSADIEAIRRFEQQWVNQGPERVQH